MFNGQAITARRVCKQVVLVTLALSITTVQSKSYGPTPSLSSPTHGLPAGPAGPPAGPNIHNGPSSGSVVEPSSKKQDTLTDDEVLPTWIVVLICVVAALFIVAFCLCAVKFYQWKKDQGTYSIWNEREPNVESMYARESGVFFEKLDIESSLCEDQCYEIPVDSFNSPQAIYVGGARVALIEQGIGESIKSSEHRMSENAKRLATIDNTEYCAVTDRINRGADICSRTESITGSTYEGDTSQRSSTTLSTRDSIPERVLTPPASDTDSYYKPLPRIMVEPVTCETYALNNHARFNALVNRPLPQTPGLGAPPAQVVDACASLDRSLLRQQREEGLGRVIFRTLPRPKKLKPLQAPFISGALSKSVSSNDVTKPEVNDHVALDSRECTLTRIKKRMSQSLDTLVMTADRASHFYENPDRVPPEIVIPEQDTPGGGHYASVSTPSLVSQDLPPDKEHLYARISTVYEPSENSNRHSYASVHYPAPEFGTRPKSRHTYISIIFGSSEPVFESTSGEDEPAGEDAGKSRSCSDLSSVHRDSTTTCTEHSTINPEHSTTNLEHETTNPELTTMTCSENTTTCSEHSTMCPEHSTTCPEHSTTCPDKPARRANRPKKHAYVNIDVGNMTEPLAPTKFPSPRRPTTDSDSSSMITEDTPTSERESPTTKNSETWNSNGNTNYSNISDLMSFSDERSPPALYVNVKEAVEASTSASLPGEGLSCADGTRKPVCPDSSRCNGESSYLADKIGSTAEDSTEISERNSDRVGSTSSSNREMSLDVDESHYGVPKTPAISLKRFTEIMARSSETDEGDIEILRNVNGVKTNALEAENACENGAKTLSTYLGERFAPDAKRSDSDTFDTQEQNTRGNRTKTLSTYLGERFAHEPTERTDSSTFDDTFDTQDENAEHVYENYISSNREISASEDSLSSCSHVSLTSSLSMDDRENESIPLISRPADVNGNDVGHVGKLELRGVGTLDDALRGESVA